MLSHRLAVGLPLGLLALASFLWPGWPGAALFLCFGLFLVVEGLREFHNMADAMHLRGNRTASYAAGIGFVLAAPLAARFAPEAPVVAAGSLDALVLGVFLVLLALDLFKGTPDRLALVRCGVSLAAIAYVVWGSSYIAKLYFSGVDGRRLVLFLVVVTKASDVGAFTVGSLTAKLPGGNHKICPRLSPKKSWEGLGGGIVASLACAFGLHFLWPDTMTLHGVQVVNAGAAVFLGCVAPVVGLLGDVAESAFKRASGFKDSGNLPGLGGVLDILDSVIPVAPVFYAYIHFLALS
jgi:phosphatidate cytidylyltransferase